MKIRIGKYKVSLKDFIKAVLQNIDNKEIIFNCSDAECVAKVKFTIVKK